MSKKVNNEEEKALSLRAVTQSLKRMAKVESHDCPRWTTRVETLLSGLSCKQLDELELELEIMRAGSHTRDLPK